MSNIIVSPEYERLINEVKQLRTRLTSIILELDELKFVTCKNIEMRYMLELGDLEYKVFKAECEYRRCKRKLELIQAKINRQEFVDINTIEQQLDQEFASFMQELDDMWDRINEAIERRSCRSLSLPEAKELKVIYRQIIKKLHPDMNPDVTDRQLQLFQSAVVAYRSGDLEAIRFIYRLIENEEFDEEELKSLEEYEDKKYEIEDDIETFQNEIDIIKTSYPYMLKDILDDEQEITKRKNEFKIELKQYESSTVQIKERINNVIKERNGVGTWLS